MSVTITEELGVPLNTWLPYADKRLFDPRMKGRKFKVRREYTSGLRKPFTNIITTSCPKCQFGGGRPFKDWMLLP